jgi:arylsulfatase A-like enzyme
VLADREYIEAVGLPLLGSGESLLQALLSPQKIRSRMLFWEHFGNKAIRQGDWKLVYGKPENQWELYNLRTDPTERQNLATAQPKRVVELRVTYPQWAEKMGIREK